MMRTIKAWIQARKNRRNAIILLMCSGVLRDAGATVRYGMTKKEIAQMFQEDPK